MKDFSKLFYFYNSFTFKILRTTILIALLFLSFYFFVNKIYPNYFIILFGIFLVFEIFFKLKVSRLMPNLEISKNTGDPIDSVTLLALSILETQQKTEGVVKSLLALPQIKFIIAKSDVTEKDISFTDVEKQTLIKNALDLAKEANGKYVTTMDLFTSYILLSEEKNKLMFNKKLKPEDIKNILIWARKSYEEEENPKKFEVNFEGEGVGEGIVYGWSLEAKKYMVDLSNEFLRDEQEPIGRANEYKQMTEALLKGGSVILVGDSGSGKESAVKQLAIQSYIGVIKENLYHQRILQLMVDSFMAGATAQGDLAQRLNALIAEVSHSGNVIIYIPEFQNILGSTSFHLDLSGAITPYLKDQEIRIIATVTPGAYKKFVEPMKSLLNSFSVIKFDEPEEQEVLQMLFRRAFLIEKKTNVTLTYKAIIAASEYADRYAKERVLPGSAVILLEDTANAVRLQKRNLVEEQDVLNQIEQKIKVSVGEPKEVEKKLLLNLEVELHKRVIDQVEAVSSISQSIRRLRAGLANKQKPISFLFLGPTGVGKTETAKALADLYFGGSARLVRLDMSEFSGSDGMKRLLGSGPGEEDEKGQLTEPVFDSPYSLVLLDEFEKADQKILDLFLQVLDDGRLTDNKGKTVSFVNSIIIATSNAASEFIREEVQKGTPVDKNFHDMLLTFLQEKNIFKPELLNRFDDIIVFKPLGEAEVVQIVGMLLTEVAKRLTEKDIKVSFDDKVVTKISTEGFDKEFGARPLRRFIQDNIEDVIAQKMLKDEISRGDNLSISVDSSNAIFIEKA